MKIPSFSKVEKEPVEIVNYLVKLNKEIKNNSLEEAEEKIEEVATSKFNLHILQIRRCKFFLPRTLFSQGLLGHGDSEFYKRYLNDQKKHFLIAKKIF
jgi:hypothetical protein